MIGPGAAVVEVARAHPRMARFTAAYIAGFVVFGLLRHDARVWSYIAVITVLLCAAALVQRVARFSPRLVWALSLAGFLHMFGGIVPAIEGRSVGPVFYETWLVPGVLKYDQLVHAVSSGVLTVACWQLLARWVDPVRCRHAALGTVAVLMACGLGALNEAFEFAMSLRLENLHVGGMRNTGWDLVFNLGGSAATAVFLVVSRAAVAASEAMPSLREATGIRV